jgi:mRNA interferase MazF
LNRGDIVLIVTPGELGKPRPAVVVQADELGAATTALIVCPMSSERGPSEHLRPSVEPTETNGLRFRSQIMTDKIVALPRHRIRRVIGSLDARVKERLDRALLVVLGLAR